MSWRRYLLNIAYVGTPFRGSQRQVRRDTPRPNDPLTIQGRLEMGLKKLNPTNEPIVYMASRTDAGVHALNTTCHVDLCRYFDIFYPSAIVFCLNKYFGKEELPIRILNARIVENDFNCRYNAKSRTYLYRICIAKHDGINKHTNAYFVPIEELTRCGFRCSDTFDLDLMRQAAQMLVGFRDFRTFMGKISDERKAIVTRRQIHSIDIFERKREQIGYSPYSWPSASCLFNDYDNHIFLDVYIKGKGFLYKQVRRTAATILAAATKQVTLRDIKFMLEVPSKHSWAPQVKTLPAQGLYLCEIEY